jgi:hypothetical protein
MDFTTLNTKNDAEAGAFLHLKHPVLGHKLYEGEGATKTGEWTDKTKSPDAVGVMVRGTESKSVQDRVKKLRKAKLKGDDAAEPDEETGLSFVCSLVIGFKGLTKDGKPMEATDENKRAFFEQSDNLVEQVMTFAQERSNFFRGTSNG